MNNALIGYTGFVGGNLLRQSSFAATYNSFSIQELRGKRYDEIWCAGVRAVKWWANSHPEEDWAGIAPLLDVLGTVRCDRFVLISTVDVFAHPRGVDETTVPERENLHPYGLHRLQVEDFIRRHFDVHTIVRLPGLFGEGLKKNAIYDLLHNHQVENIHADSRFQFYDLSSVAVDCRKACAADLRCIHFAVEPVTVRDMAAQAFGKTFDNRPEQAPAAYDMRTVHAGLWGKTGPYMQDGGEVLTRIAAFVSREEAERD